MSAKTSTLTRKKQRASFKPGIVMLGSFLALALSPLHSSESWAAKRGSNGAVDSVKKVTENSIRNMVDPLLTKFCQDQCKLLGVDVSVDLAVQDEVAPGFDDAAFQGADDLEPSNARIKILMDDKIGPVSRGKLTDLIQQHLDTLDYPVTIEAQLAHFPAPIGSSGKVAELREKVTQQFRSKLEELTRQFCPEQCLITEVALSTETVNGEEAQYGSSGEFFQDNGVAIRISDLRATLLLDETLTPTEQANLLEMAKLRTNSFKNVTLDSKAFKFPRPTTFAQKSMGGLNGNNGTTSREDQTNRTLASESSSTDSKTSQTQSTSATSSTSNQTESLSKNTNNTNNNTESNARQERFERIEKIERVESGDAVQQELQKFKVFGLIFACSIISLLIFLTLASFRPRNNSGGSTVQRVIQQLAADPVSYSGGNGVSAPNTALSQDERNQVLAKRYEIENLKSDLTRIFAEQPKVAKQVFTRILTDDGVEDTAQYIHLFGESIVIDMIRDPSLQGEVSELMEYYAKNPMELTDDEKIELLRKLHNRTVAGKLVVMGSRSSHLFDFLADMDGIQIMELLRNESITVKAIILTQCDLQKRSSIYSQLDEESRMKLLTELSRIDYLPRDYIFNVANALKRKRRENPKLNTESLPGSDVLLTLLERTRPDMARNVVRNLEISSPETARTVKSRLVTLDTLRFMKDNQLLEVVLSLRHDELLQFLKGAPDEIRSTIFSKSPKELVSEIEEELETLAIPSRDSVQLIERKIINRIRLMANDGTVNLVETNERMFANGSGDSTLPGFAPQATNPEIKKVAGW